ncbi:hypothetical protein FOZ62_019069, partial [Perkinsus olseni]
ENIKNASEDKQARLDKMEETMESMIQRLAFEEARSEQLERLLSTANLSRLRMGEDFRMRVDADKSMLRRAEEKDSLRQILLDKLALTFGTIDSGFRRLDFNGSGKVCLHELQMFSDRLGLCSETLSDIFFRLDRGRKGYLTRSDLLEDS